MSFQQDVEDTARLYRESAPEQDTGHARADDTDRMRLAGGATLDDRTGAWQVHAYAQGIIRFYRARSILEKDLNAASCRRAWRYLDRLQPNDLPGAARSAFFELTYLVRSQPRLRAFESGEFPTRVFEITGLIDDFVDELNREIDS